MSKRFGNFWDSLPGIGTSNYGFLSNSGDRYFPTYQAIADFSRLIKIYSDHTSVYYNRGTVYLEQGKYELAIADYNRANEITPKYIEAYRKRGEFYAKQGEDELATADYNRANEIKPFSIPSP